MQSKQRVLVGTMKKGLVLLLVVLFVSTILLAKGVAETKDITLELPSYQAEEAGFKDWWNWNITKFENENPGVKIKLIPAAYEPHHQDLQMRCSTGNAPDLIHLSSRYFYRFAEEGWLEPLNGRLKDTDIPENWGPVLDYGKFNGETYSITLSAYAYGLFYNEAMFKQAGVSVPKNFEELVRASEKLTADKDGDGRTDQFGFDMFVSETSSAYMLTTQMLIGNGTHWIAQDGKLQFLTDPKIEETLNGWRKIVKNGWSPEGLTDVEARKHFMSGNAAMLIDGSWVSAMIREAPVGVKENVKIARVPFTYIPGGPSNCIGISSGISQERKDIAWRFLEQLASQGSQEMYAKSTGQPAPRKSALTEEIVKNSPGMDVFAAAQMSASDSYLPTGYESYFAQFSDVIVKGLMKLAVTDTPTRKVLEEMQQGVLGIKK